MAWLTPLSVMVLAIFASFAIPFAMVWPVVAYTVSMASAVLLAPKSCRCPDYAHLGSGRAKHAVAMLVSNDTVPEALRALGSLHTYFNNCFRKDVFVFHDGSMPQKTQVIIARLHPQVRIRLLTNLTAHWRAAPPDRPKDAAAAKRYATIRWQTMGLFDYLAGLGYEWLLRVEPRARLLSCVSEDPFQVLESSGKKFGYRISRFATAPGAATGLPYMLKEEMAGAKRPMPLRAAAHFRGEPNINTWDRWTVDSSLLLTRISAWRAPAVRAWFKNLDDKRIVFDNPVEDSALQTVTQLAYLEEQEVHRFQGWSFMSDGELAVPLGTVLPGPVGGLLPSDLEWVGSMDDLRRNPRYRAEINWVFRNIVKPVSTRQFWNFRILSLVR